MTEANFFIASVAVLRYNHISRLAFDPDRRKLTPAVDHLAHDAEDAIARLDERLRLSPIREGWIARTHYLDAAASLWLEGDLVALEDLVLHDLSMDVRTPTHELTRAHMMLAARRRIAGSPPGWACERDAQDVLLGRVNLEAIAQVAKTPPAEQGGEMPLETPLDAEFAAIDALIARTSRLLVRGGMSVGVQDDVARDRLSEWQARLRANDDVSPVAAAAAAGQAWEDLAPIENASWLGRLLAADILRIRGKTRVHLCPLNLGLKAVARGDRQARNPEIRRRAWVQGFALAAETGLRDHDRWLAVQQTFAHKLKGRRTTSKLPALAALAMRQPLVTSATIARELGISGRAAQDLAGELGLREMTGRGRYRAWGFL